MSATNVRGTNVFQTNVAKQREKHRGELLFAIKGKSGTDGGEAVRKSL
jgi:hypothetical protein